jgi:hypothetical protein
VCFDPELHLFSSVAAIDALAAAYREGNTCPCLRFRVQSTDMTTMDIDVRLPGA